MNAPKRKRATRGRDRSLDQADCAPSSAVGAKPVLQPVPPILATVWRRRIKHLRLLDFTDDRIADCLRSGEATYDSKSANQAERRERKGTQLAVDILRSVSRAEKHWGVGEYSAAVDAIIEITALEAVLQYGEMQAADRVAGARASKASQGKRVSQFMEAAIQQRRTMRKTLGYEPAPKEIHSATESAILAKKERTISEKTFYKHWRKLTKFRSS